MSQSRARPSETTRLMNSSVNSSSTLQAPLLQKNDVIVSASIQSIIPSDTPIHSLMEESTVVEDNSFTHEIFSSTQDLIRKVFFEYLSLEDATQLCYLPDGILQLAYYLNDETQLNLFLITTFNTELQNFHNRVYQWINTQVNYRNAMIASSWNPLRYSTVPRLLTLGGLGTLLWQGTARLIRNGIDGIKIYNAFLAARDQLEEVCRNVFPADFYGRFHCNADYTICNVVERTFFDDNCANYGSSGYSRYSWGPNVWLAHQLQNCAPNVWSNFTVACDAYQGGGTIESNGWKIAGGAVVGLLGAGIASSCCVGYGVLDLVTTETIMNEPADLSFMFKGLGTSSPAANIVDEKDLKHVAPKSDINFKQELFHKIVLPHFFKKERSTVREICKQLDLLRRSAYDAPAEVKSKFSSDTAKQTTSCAFFRKAEPQIQLTIIDDVPDSTFSLSRSIT